MLKSYTLDKHLQRNQTVKISESQVHWTHKGPMTCSLLPQHFSSLHTAVPAFSVSEAPEPPFPSDIGQAMGAQTKETKRPWLCPDNHWLFFYSVCAYTTCTFNNYSTLLAFCSWWREPLTSTSPVILCRHPILHSLRSLFIFILIHQSPNYVPSPFPQNRNTPYPQNANRRVSFSVRPLLYFSYSFPTTQSSSCSSLNHLSLRLRFPINWLQVPNRGPCGCLFPSLPSGSLKYLNSRGCVPPSRLHRCSARLSEHNASPLFSHSSYY